MYLSTMKKIFALSILLLLAACYVLPTPAKTPAAATPSSSPTTAAPALPALSPEDSPILISEVMAGKQGNNNYEFIELYNRSSLAADLKGWALWYRLPTSKEDLFVYRWSTPTLVAPQGHYLLTLEGQDIGLQPDATYTQPINITGGGLQLRQTDGKVRDRLGWGKAPQDFFAGEPSPSLQNGQSIERGPGSSAGNFQDSVNNLQDFHILAQPDPQNSNSPLTPLPAQRLEIHLEAPETAAPGDSFGYTVVVTNHTNQDLKDITVTFPVPPELAIPDVPASITLETTGSPGIPVASWKISTLAKDQASTTVLSVMVPYTYFTALAQNYTAQAANWPAPAYGGVARTRITGGVIPIGTARTLLNSEMTIEGIATMYTGGYFAGAGNNKFYLQDETGGIQVQVFTGQGTVSVKIGDRVRVRGKVSIYRGSVQIVPTSVPDDVQVLESGVGDPAPTPASIEETQQQPGLLPGRLVQVQGNITRVEEYSYSYEIDLFEISGQPEATPLTLYVDKQAGINVEDFVPGQQLTAAGILDGRDTRILLYPRRQSDLAQRYPPVLRITAGAPLNVQPGESFTVTLSVFNHLTQAASPVVVTATLPANTALQAVLDGGTQADGGLRWELASLPAGGSAQVHFRLSATAPVSSQENSIQIWPYGAAAPQAGAPANGQAFYTFIGQGVPIWAIQGDGFRSPYAGSILTTVGVVTGIFPELGGFFIQETPSDDDPATSSGLFVLSPLTPPDKFSSQYPALAEGSQVQVSGKIREPSQQTVIEIQGPQAVTLLAQGAPLPQPIALDPPASLTEALPYFETLEGMRVSLNGPALAVSPVSKFGEYVVVLPKHGQDRLFQGQDNGIMIMVDDGSSTTYTDGTQQPYQVSTGDQITGLTGPLAYTYGRYKIEPVMKPQVIPGAPALPSLPAVGSEEYSIMTWNVENLFDTVAPHPSDPPIPLPSEYRIDVDKVASTIQAAGFPIIIGLQEVENIRVLNDIAAHPLLAGFDYKTILFEGNDLRGIDVGFLVRSDRATILDAEPRPAPDGLFSRPPLVLHVQVETEAGQTELYIINNHFASMSAGVEATEPQRTAQALWNVTLVQEILQSDPKALVAVIGDLNSYFEFAPIQALREGGMSHVFDTLPAAERYTYIYQGESQVLDHILLTPTLLAALSRVQVLHVNADYPLPAPEDTSPKHKSDHDPVIATFLIK